MRNRALLSIMIMTALFSAGCREKHQSVNGEERPLVGIKGVGVENVKSGAIPELLDVAGTVRARTSALVSTRIPGTITQLRVREGDRVKKGQLLVQLEAAENQATAAVATAGIDEARRALEEAQSRKKLAGATFERYQNLFKELAVSRQEFEVRQAEKELASQGVARAEARLVQAEQGAKASATVSDYTRIVSPISGIIAGKQVDLGASVFPGQPLLTIEDDTGYQLELALPENLAARVKTGSSLQITIDSVGGSFTGRIAEIVPTADPLSRTFVAKIPLSQKGLKSGMFGRGSLALGTTLPGITVPRTALVERGALTSVWIVDRDNILRMRIVKSGRTVGSRIEILTGVSDGDRVVVSGSERVTEGAKVE